MLLASSVLSKERLFFQIKLRHQLDICLKNLFTIIFLGMFWFLTLMRVSVKIFYFTVFDKGILEIDLNDDSRVKDLLKKLHNMYNESFIKIHGKNLFDSFGSYFNVFLNGTFLHLPSDLNKMLENGDSFLIVHPVSGG